MDTLEKRAVQNLWFKMSEHNPDCDALIVDSNSPLLPHVPAKVAYYTFADNIGHLSHGGRDGWGRAFCYGLQYAIKEKYDWVVHVEGDSLCKLDLAKVAAMLDETGSCAATIPLSSWKTQIETGFIFFSVEWLRDTKFVELYDWSSRTRYPEPEKVVKSMCGSDLHIMKYHGMRDDFKELTVDNVAERGLSWLTHAALPVMERFAVALS